jgi:hypothetical protein
MDDQLERLNAESYQMLEGMLEDYLQPLKPKSKLELLALGLALAQLSIKVMKLAGYDNQN